MKRKIISIISVFAVLCSFCRVPVLAAKQAEVDEYKLSVLKGLDILEDKLPTRITVENYVEALMGYVLEDDEKNLYTPEEFARSVGMVEPGEEYKKSGAVSVDIAVEYAVKLLGYNEDILPDINYKSIGSSQKLLKGVDVSTALKPADMIVLLYNLLEAEPLLVGQLSKVDNTYYTSNKQTLLSVYRDIYTYKDIVVADENTSIYSSQGVGSDRVRIGDYTFEIACDYDESLLGCFVNAYIKDDGDIDATVIFIDEAQNRNERLVVWDNDLLSVNQNYTIVEYESDTNKVRKIKLGAHPKVIINGVFYGDYTRADLMPESGYVEFIDNNSDGLYDILIVKSYQTMVVDSINIDQKVIKNKFEFANALNTLDLEPDGYYVEYSVSKDEKEIKLSDIAVGDVLSVAMSKAQGDRKCEILVSSDKKEFSVGSVEMSEGEISDGDNIYTLSEDYVSHLNFRNERIKLGNVYEFRFDPFGRVAYSKIVSQDEYVMFFRFYEDETEDGGFVRYLDTDGEWRDARLANRVSIDNVGDKAAVMMPSLSAMDPQVVKIKLNSDGEVRYITTATQMTLDQAKNEEDGFTKIPETSYVYRPICASFSNIIYLADGAKLFVMPDNVADKYNKEKYYVIDASGYFVEDAFNIVAYDIDRFGYTKLLTVKGGNESKRMSDSLFVITDIKTAIDMEGEVRMQLKGCGGGYKDISFLAKEISVLTGLKKGDVINFMLDKTGMINKVSSPLSRLDDSFTKSNSGSGDEYYAKRYINAEVAEVDYEMGRIILDYGTGEITFPYKSSVNCMEYNRKTKDCELTTYDSVVKGDKVMVMTKHYGIVEVIRICE